MLPLTDSIIRSSFVNASRKEVKDLVLPDDLECRDWDALDYFGWCDPKFARRAYAILPLPDGTLAGVLFRQASASPRSRAMCDWCRDVRLPNEVVLYTARRVGDAGRRGATVGIMICQGFECSRNVRNDPPPAYEGFDVAEARERRIETLRRKASGFADALVSGR